MAEEPIEDAAEAGQLERPIQDFIFARELAEVYLLLDNVSTTGSKVLPVVDENDPVFGDELRRTGKSWIEQICEISWPPVGGTFDRAEQAAKLIRARDILNRAAAPATGATIAFTLLVSGEEGPSTRAVHRKDLNRLQQLLVRLAGVEVVDQDGLDDGPPGPPTPPAGPGRGGGKPPSRRSLASMAFPSLASKARRFRTQMLILVTALVLWLVATCVMSWDVATGTALLGRLDTTHSAHMELLKQIADAEDAVTRTDTNSSSATGQPRTVQPATAPGTPPHVYCQRPSSMPGASTATEAPPISLTEMRLCSRKQDVERQRSVALDNLSEWLGCWSEAHLLPCLLFSDVGARQPSHRVEPQGANEQWAAILVAVVGGTVLPIFYGVLGAGAAVVRSLSAKMRDSLLAPRDLTLSLVQVALGALIGACVGLFITPAGNGDADGLLGSVPLTASALCFIAGFGVEGVFLALESLMRRVFNLEPRTTHEYRARP